MATFALNQAGFGKLFEDKPRDWVQAIAVRCALRVLPFALDAKISSAPYYDPGATKSLLLLMALSSGAARVSPHNRDLAFHNAADWAQFCYVSTFHAVDFIRIANAARSSTIAAKSSDVNGFVVHAISNALHDYDDSAAALPPMLDDFKLLNTLGSGAKLLAAPLWLKQQPAWFDVQWARASKWLEDAPEEFAWWRPWYEAKLRGSPYEFPRFDEAAESEFFTRLLAKDRYWWVLDAGPANAEVAGWVAELSRPKLSDAVIEADPQVRSAPIFAASPYNKISIDHSQSIGDLRTDLEAQSLHRIAVQRVQEVAERLRGNNAAEGFSPIAERVLQALSADILSMRAGNLVLETESLRAEYAEQQNPGPTDDWAPLSGRLKRVVEDAISALQLYIGSDPFLEEMETRRLGPDYAPPLAPPSAMIVLADALKRDDLSDDEADHIIRLAAENAPMLPNPGDRRSSIATQVGLNVVRWAINFLVEYERDLPDGIAVLGVIGLVAEPLSTAATAAFAWGLAKNIKNNETKWRAIASQAGVTAQNFERLLVMINRLPLGGD